MKKMLVAAVALCLSACGCPSCEKPYPNATPEGLCCDASWSMCLDSSGRIVAAP